MAYRKIGDGIIISKISRDELEESLSGLTKLKPILQKQVFKGNGCDIEQAFLDARELGLHFDTAIEAMTVLLTGFEEGEL